MATIEKRKYVYFLYSQAQHQMCQTIENKVNRDYIPGKVLSNGKMRDFTEISTVPRNNKYSDAKVVAEGYLDSMEYKNPNKKWRWRS